MVDISHAESKIQRHNGVPEMQNGGFIEISTSSNHPYTHGGLAALRDSERIASGRGGGVKISDMNSAHSVINVYGKGEIR